MAKFQVLTGKALTSAIAGRAKAIATFTEREHQIAYSALNHVELHNDPKYLNALYSVTPANYRGGLRAWAMAFGKVSFDGESGEFAYAKSKTSDMVQAMEIAPANYQKTTKAKADTAFDEIKHVEASLKKLTDNGASPQVIKAMEGVLRVAKSAHLSVVSSDMKAAA